MSELRRAAALEESEHRFARFMNHLPGLAWIKDAAGRYLFVNAAAERAFGRFQGAILGRTDAEIFPPATAAEFRSNDARALAGGGAMETVETLEHEDGVHHSLVSKFPIPAGLGGQSVIGGIAIDITERIRIEQALREADRHKDEFLATLAHELRNPLAPMRNALEVVRVAGEADAAELARARGIMERQLRQMVRLIDDLLDVSRISRGKLELRKERLTLAAVLESAVETTRPALDASGRELVLDAARGAAAARGRLHAARPGVREPAPQRGQVHRAGRADLAPGPGRGRLDRDPREGRRDRDPGRVAVPGVRDVHAGGPRDRRRLAAAWASASASCETW